MSTQKKEIIEAILTNSSLTTAKKSEVIAQFLDEFNENYPELKYHATKNDVLETELKLTKEIKVIEKEIQEIKKATKEDNQKLELQIKEVDKEIKQLEKTTKEEMQKLELQIKEFDKRAKEDNYKLELKLTKEIENTHKEIKELEVKLTKEIQLIKTDTIKWTAGIVFALFIIALSGLILTTFKLFLH